jgi:hypothetical protein
VSDSNVASSDRVLLPVVRGPRLPPVADPFLLATITQLESLL